MLADTLTQTSRDYRMTIQRDTEGHIPGTFISHAMKQWQKIYPQARSIYYEETLLAIGKALAK